jgi:hypothetical protein
LLAQVVYHLQRMNLSRGRELAAEIRRLGFHAGESNDVRRTKELDIQMMLEAARAALGAECSDDEDAGGGGGASAATTPKGGTRDGFSAECGDIALGFGLHIGWAVEGAIGSTIKIDASYLSPHVNLASRLEAATKQYGVPILMSGDFHALLSPPVQQRCRMLDRVTVKGSLEPISVFTWDFLPVADKDCGKPNNNFLGSDGKIQSYVSSGFRRLADLEVREEAADDAARLRSSAHEAPHPPPPPPASIRTTALLLRSAACLRPGCHRVPQNVRGWREQVHSGRLGNGGKLLRTLQRAA